MLSSLVSFAGEWILPFVLVFVLVFAILQKSKILGDGKTQIDTMISLVIALITLLVPAARHFIMTFTPWLAVALAVILVFLILYGFVGGDLKSSPSWMKIVFGILAAIFVIIAVIYASGSESFITNLISGEIVSNVFMFLIIIVAVIVVVVAGKKE